MKRNLISVTMAACIALMTGLVGCGGGSTTASSPSSTTTTVTSETSNKLASEDGTVWTFDAANSTWSGNKSTTGATGTMTFKNKNGINECNRILKNKSGDYYEATDGAWDLSGSTFTYTVGFRSIATAYVNVGDKVTGTIAFSNGDKTITITNAAYKEVWNKQ